VLSGATCCAKPDSVTNITLKIKRIFFIFLFLS